MAQQPSRKDKQASINQNRQVGNQSRKKSAPTKAGGRSSASLLTWGLVGVVILAVVGLVLYSVLGSSKSTAPSGGGSQPAPASVSAAVTQIPLSVYNTVGITSSVVPVTAPTAISGQPPLTFSNTSGTSLPGMFYYGAEYCPYCAAERWAVAAAVSRFGSLSGLNVTTSSSTDVFPSTQTLSFAKATFESQYFVMKTIESSTNIPNPAGGYTALQRPTSSESALLKKYDNSTYVPGGQTGSIPFIDIGNSFLVAGSSFSPSVLQGLSHQQIASGLNDASNPATQAIVAAANYLTASICKITNGQPGNVCTSKGVLAAAKSMNISF